MWTQPAPVAFCLTGVWGWVTAGLASLDPRCRGQSVLVLTFVLATWLPLLQVSQVCPGSPAQLLQSRPLRLFLAHQCCQKTFQGLHWGIPVLWSLFYGLFTYLNGIV